MVIITITEDSITMFLKAVKTVGIEAGTTTIIEVEPWTTTEAEGSTVTGEATILAGETKDLVIEEAEEIP